jgi:hypothetical protein
MGNDVAESRRWESDGRRPVAAVRYPENEEKRNPQKRVSIFILEDEQIHSVLFLI